MLYSFAILILKSARGESKCKNFVSFVKTRQQNFGNFFKFFALDMKALPLQFLSIYIYSDRKNQIEPVVLICYDLRKV